MKITKAKLKQIIKEELEEGGYAGHYIKNETDELKKQLAVLNAKADAAREAGDRQAYEDIVDKMIELENAHLDAGGELPLPKHKDQELSENDPNKVIASIPSSREGDAPYEMLQWHQDELDARDRAYKYRRVLDDLKSAALAIRSNGAPDLDSDGDGLTNAGTVKMLLQRYFDNNFGAKFNIEDFADKIDQYASGAGLNEVKKMKITKTQLKEIIKEELDKITEGNIEAAIRNEIEEDARDAGISEEEMQGMDNKELIAAIEDRGDIAVTHREYSTR